MKHHQLEEILLGVIIKNNDTDIPKRVARELSIIRITKPELRKIYSAVCECVKKGKSPDPLNLDIELKNDDSYGGYDYLLSLINLPDVLHVNSNGSLSSLVNKVDTNGRLWYLREVIQDQARFTEDFESLLSKVSDIDELYANVAQKIKSTEPPKTSYKPISEAVDKALMKFDQEEKGEVISIVPCGLPQLAKYYIPRPRSFGCILGFPSTGKTSLGIQVLLGAANELKKSGQPGKVYFHTLDTTDENMAKLIGCMLARIDSMIHPSMLSKEQRVRFRTCLEWVKTLPFEYNDNLLTSFELKKEALWSAYECPRVLSISDYAEKFSDKHNQSEELRMNQIIVNHREVCWDTHSCEILLSQPGPDAVKDPSKIMTLADARYTRSFEHNLDWGLVIWNPPAMTARGTKYQLPKGRRDDQAVIFAQKNKGYATGEIYFEWIAQYSMFRDTSLPMNHFWDSEPWQFTEPEW